MIRHRLSIGVLFAWLVILCVGCTLESKTPTNNEPSQLLPYNDYIKAGNEIALRSQFALLANLSGAISQDGFVGAISFCNHTAIEITDSLSQHEGAKVSRITSRARNSKNKLQTNDDRKAWVHYSNVRSKSKAPDTVFYEAIQATFYKPIFIVSETCLSCHGSRSLNIELDVLEAIDELYPTDPAVNYQMNDLRGLWKIQFN